jgi:hypothetical protein
VQSAILGNGTYYDSNKIDEKNKNISFVPKKFAMLAQWFWIQWKDFQLQQFYPSANLKIYRHKKNHSGTSEMVLITLGKLIF